MNYISKTKILEHLGREGANESELCEVCGTDINYFMVYPNISIDFDIESDYLGKVIIKCEEGFIQIPILEYCNHSGFEQFDLDRVETISKDEVQRYYDEFIRKSKFIKELLEN